MRVPRFISVEGFISNQDFLGTDSVDQSATVVNSQSQDVLNRFPTIKWLAKSAVSHIALPVADVATIFAVVVLTAACCGNSLGYEVLFTSSLLSLILFASFALFGLYPGIGLTPAVEIRLTSIIVSTLLSAYAAATIVSTRNPWILFSVSLIWLGLLVALPISRGAMRTILANFSWWGASAIVVGTGETGVSIFQSLRDNPTWGLRPVGMVDDRVRLPGAAGAYLGNASDMERLVKKHGVTWCIVAIPDRPRADVLRLVDSYAGLIPNSLVVPDLAGLPSLWTAAVDCGGFPGLRLKERLLMPIPKLAKRVMDLLLATSIAVALLPMFLALAAIVKLTSRGPIFFSQDRIGLNGEAFRIWKFRTMVVNAEEVLAKYLDENSELKAEWEKNSKLKKDPRITGIGHLLRKTSLDEFPQIWNVLTGDMSLVGPRPIWESDLEKYGKSSELYLRVRPGITGLWQVSGRNNTTFEQRVQLDGYYVRNWSPWLDLCILLVTVRVVLLREGAY
jgi:Undecaprenyl-phosphate galactose phosphotransferase WbaP